MINLNQPIKNIDGTIAKSKIRVPVLQEVNGEEVEVEELQSKDVTVGAMLIHACLRNIGDTSVDSVMTRYKLFNKMNGKDEVEFSEAERTLMTTLICDAVEVYYAGQIIELLNQEI
jgi:hypothetical protein